MDLSSFRPWRVARSLEMIHLCMLEQGCSEIWAPLWKDVLACFLAMIGAGLCAVAGFSSIAQALITVASSAILLTHVC
jgi:hypothetical protein